MVRRAARIPPLFLTPRHVSPIQKKVGSAGPSRRGAPIAPRWESRNNSQCIRLMPASNPR